MGSGPRYFPIYLKELNEVRHEVADDFFWRVNQLYTDFATVKNKFDQLNNECRVLDFLIETYNHASQEELGPGGRT